MGLLSRLAGWAYKTRMRSDDAPLSTFVRDVPVFINCRDRVTCLRRLVTWLENSGHENIVLIDNDSSWPSLLEFYEKCSHTVVRAGRNLGHTALWQLPALERTLATHWFVYSDPDVLPDENCPTDLVWRLKLLLEGRDPRYVKAGPALRTDDLPDHYRLKADAIAYEQQFYNSEIAPGVFHSFIDTTFALYRPGTSYSHGPALRTRHWPARHLAWYVDSDHLDAEEQYYRARADRTVSHWDGDLRPVHR